jgi:two-component system chemotaxis response regulator CheB
MNDSEIMKILVVDDTILYRKIVSEILSELPNVEIVGTASNGKTAISRIGSLQPDLITLDIDMPSMDGIAVLEEINRLSYDVGVIMFSSLTHEGSEMTIKALELGAFDFIPKPELDSIEANKQYIRQRFAPLLRSFADRRVIKKILSGQAAYKSPRREIRPAESAVSDTFPKIPAAHDKAAGRKRKSPSEVVAIGISTGGPKALAEVIPNIPATINVPILIVQHMPPLFTQSLAKSLDSKAAVRVKEAQDGDALTPNTIFIAPGGKQMRVDRRENGAKILRICDDPPENSCKPSVDYLFRSIAEHFGEKATGIIMTGMGSDGSLGIEAMKARGAFIIAQDEASCTVFGMPKRPIESGLVDLIAPLDNIAAEIINAVKQS